MFFLAKCWIFCFSFLVSNSGASGETHSNPLQLKTKAVYNNDMISLQKYYLPICSVAWIYTMPVSITKIPTFNLLWICIQDPNSNRIAQWLNQSTVSGILDLSHPMSAEATQGSYIITAWNEKGEQTSQNFDVKEYGEKIYLTILFLHGVVQQTMRN